MTSLVAQLILRMWEHLEQEHQATRAGSGGAEGEDTCTISTDALSYSAISDDSDLVVFARNGFSVDSGLERTSSDHYDHVGFVWVCVRAAYCVWGPAWVMWAL